MKLVILSFAVLFVLCLSEPQPQSEQKPHSEPHGEPHAELNEESHGEPHSEPKTEPHSEPEVKADQKGADHSQNAAAEGEPLAPKAKSTGGNGASKMAVALLPLIFVPLLMI